MRSKPRLKKLEVKEFPEHFRNIPEFEIPFKLIPDKKTTKLEKKRKQSNNKTLYRVLLLLCLYFIISLLLL